MVNPILEFLTRLLYILYFILFWNTALTLQFDPPPPTLPRQKSYQTLTTFLGNWTPNLHHREQNSILQENKIENNSIKSNSYQVKSCFEILRGPALFWLIRKHLKTTYFVRTHLFKWKTCLSMWNYKWSRKRSLLTIHALVSFLSWSFLTTVNASWMLASINSSEEPFT